MAVTRTAAPKKVRQRVREDIVLDEVDHTILRTLAAVWTLRPTREARIAWGKQDEARRLGK